VSLVKKEEPTLKEIALLEVKSLEGMIGGENLVQKLKE
jgi:hypothetical protein